MGRGHDSSPSPEPATNDEDVELDELAWGTRRTRRHVVILASALVAVIAVGIGLWFGHRGDDESASNTKPQRARVLGGLFTLEDYSGWDRTVGDGCTGSGGYDDIREGAQVVVRDGGGRTLALGSLGGGEMIAATCVFPFEIPGVPRSRFYSVEVSHRGEVNFSREDLVANQWVVQLSLG